MRGREKPLPCGRKACAERNGNMDKLIEKLETSVENGAEVIVVGGGIAGVAAAVAAARSGADVLLLEKARCWEGWPRTDSSAGMSRFATGTANSL